MTLAQRSAVFVVSVASVLSASSLSAQTVITIAGADAPAIQASVDAFRNLLGTLNPNDPGSVGSGRREIHWDSIADSQADPSLLPSNFYNAVESAGVLLVGVLPTTTFKVSADAANLTLTPVEFGGDDAGYPTAFATFSAERLLTPVGDNVFDVEFVNPGGAQKAAVRGFGAVFCDVDVANATKMEFYRGHVLLRTENVATLAGNGGMSFLGVDFGSNVVTRVRITLGEAELGTPDVTQGGASDIVVLDDFILGEPGAIIATIDTLLADLIQLRDEADEVTDGTSSNKKMVKRIEDAIEHVEKAKKKVDQGKPEKAKGQLEAGSEQLKSFQKLLGESKAVGNIVSDDRLKLAEYTAQISVDFATLIVNPQ